MKATYSSVHRRINITLPEETLKRIDRVANKGDRSSFIDSAVQFYIERIGRENVRQAIKEGSIMRAERDLQIAEEWFHLDEEAWQKSQEK